MQRHRAVGLSGIHLPGVLELRANAFLIAGPDGFCEAGRRARRGGSCRRRQQQRTRCEAASRARSHAQVLSSAWLPALAGSSMQAALFRLKAEATGETPQALYTRSFNTPVLSPN